MLPSTVGKIPEDAKRVFKGVIFDVYQWEQEMFDGSTATFEAVKRPASVEVIPVIGSKILLSFEEQPSKAATYGFFGGRPEEGEEFVETAKRELLEETGLKAQSVELLKDYIFSGKIEWHLCIFVAHDCEKTTEQKLDGGEKIEIREVNFDDFVKIASTDDFYGPMHFKLELLRMKQDPAKLAEFKSKLFG